MGKVVSQEVMEAKKNIAIIKADIMLAIGKHCRGPGEPTATTTEILTALNEIAARFLAFELEDDDTRTPAHQAARTGPDGTSPGAHE